MHGNMHKFLFISCLDVTTTEEEKAQKLLLVPTVEPILSREGYDPDLRRCMNNGVHVVSIQVCESDDNMYVVNWSDQWTTIEPKSNLIETESYCGFKSEFFDMLKQQQFLGKPFLVTGAKELIWCINNYKQDRFGFCTVHCVNNFVDYKKEHYDYFVSFGKYLPLREVISKSISFCKGSFRFQKYPPNKKKCFCEENVKQHSCVKSWLLAQKVGKFVVESEGHCYSWDSDAQLVLDTEKGGPKRISAEIYEELDIGIISNMYRVIPMQLA